MSDSSRKVQMNFNDHVTGVAGNVEGDFVVNPNPKSPADAAAEIQEIIAYLQQTYPTNLETAIQQEVKRSPTFKARLRNAIKEAGLETVKVIFAPLGIGIEAIRGWVEAE